MGGTDVSVGNGVKVSVGKTGTGEATAVGNGVKVDVGSGVSWPMALAMRSRTSAYSGSTSKTMRNSIRASVQSPMSDAAAPSA